MLCMAKAEVMEAANSIAAAAVLLPLTQRCVGQHSIQRRARQHQLASTVTCDVLIWCTCSEQISTCRGEAVNPFCASLSLFVRHLYFIEEAGGVDVGSNSFM